MNVLIVDDDPAVRTALRRMLAGVADVVVREAATEEAAIAAVAAEPPDLMLLDIRLSADPDRREGLSVLRALRRLESNVPTVIVTSSSAIEDLREAMRLGASDYVLKDELSIELFLPIVESFRERALLRVEVRRLRARVDGEWGIAALIGSSPAMTRLRRLVTRLADATATVLIRGETGTGKELVARALHQESGRREHPFVAVNCSAVPGTLLESTLFGHERGAFTGADRRRRGRLEAAGEGTVLLDEIGDMPLELQSKLLRVLERGQVLPLGADREILVRARVLAATNANLEALMEQGRFRRDLFYRLNVVSISVPTLAERGIGDVQELIERFARDLPRRITYDRSAIEWLLSREWPGNVRELRNALQRASLLAEGDAIGAGELRQLLEPAPEEDGNATYLERLIDVILAADAPNKCALLESTLFRRAYERTGSISAAARLLGVHRKALTRRWNRLETEAADDEEEGGD